MGPTPATPALVRRARRHRAGELLPPAGLRAGRVGGRGGRGGLIASWTAFARTGDPGDPGDRHGGDSVPGPVPIPWAPFGAGGAEDGPVLSLAAGPGGIAPVPFVADHQCDFWLSR